MSPASGTDSDPTRKQRRDQAREQRRAMEAAAAAQATRRKRMIQLGGIVGVVVVVIAVILVATSGGGSSPPPKTGGGTGNPESKTVATLLKGIPQSGNVLGNPNAPVTLKYFGDLECPICKEFTLGAYPSLIEKYVRPGKLKVEYLSMETATDEPEVFKTQQVAAYAAGKQNLGWYFIELFYHEQGQEKTGYVTESYLQGLAQQVPGLNLPNWSAARNDPALAEEVKKDEQIAAQEGFTGTPSFLIGKSGGPFTKLESPNLEQPSDFESAINKLLA
ncbi:MAG TPA: thioredoxin domain-containing protein [Solirubrobacteraceae bacterium]|nr:thioredoxin domain-containing protein [Solirubrobacteraceae bacterium]